MPIKSQKPQYVVDASVAVKWFSAEDGTARARELLKRGELGEAELFAPELLLYELGNALLKGKHFQAQDIVKALEEILGSSIEFLRLDRTLMKYAAHFATAYNLTFYDAFYAAVAYELRAPLVSENTKDHSVVREITLKRLAFLRQ